MAKLNNSLDDMSQKKQGKVIDSGNVKINIQSQDSESLHSHVDDCSSASQLDDGSVKQAF